ncbi:MAG: hypothetical protein CSB24_02775, partial [Deltaproteobacteria bacterium]
MRFLHPAILWLLAALPLLLLLKGRKGPAPAVMFSSTATLASMAEKRKNSPGRIALLLKLITLALLITALARPQYGSSTTEIEASGVDILLAVDVSGSMKAMDFKLDHKSASRLEVVKSVVRDFIAARPNDRIGLVAFAGKPYMVSPLTLDHQWLEKRLQSLAIGMIEDGTAIGSAIGSGINRLRDQDSKSRLLILLTDGMNNTGKLTPLLAAEAAKTFKIKVYTVGAGTRGLAPIPVTDVFGRKVLRQEKVNIDEKTLRQVAEMTGAKYFRATDTDSLEQI